MHPFLFHFVVALALTSAPLTRATDASTNSAAALPRTDANGNPLRRAPTGHVSNYDEAKVGTYTLPDPLTLQDGQPVRDEATWYKQRRPEILKLYETEIYGGVPERAPKVRFEVAETEANALDGAAVRKHIVGHIGDGADGPKMNVTLYLPAKATVPVPVMLHLVFFGGASASTNSSRPRFSETGPITNILARGYGYATFRYTEIEGDSRTNNLTLVRKLALALGQTQPAADEWGTITAWAWGASRVLDYFETDRAVDAKRVALVAIRVWARPFCGPARATLDSCWCSPVARVKWARRSPAAISGRLWTTWPPTSRGNSPATSRSTPPIGTTCPWTRTW